MPQKGEKNIDFEWGFPATSGSLLRVLSFIVFLFFLTPGFCLAMRCGAKLVSIEDTKDEVRHKCGEPQGLESWVEHRVKGYSYPHDYSPDTDRYYGSKYNPYAITVEVTIEEWTYNFGSARFIRYLRFENGKLKRIKTGEYGY